MRNNLYPFVISLVLIGVIQLIGINKNNYTNDIFIEKNTNNPIRKELIAYTANFNPALMDSIAYGRIDEASDTLDQVGPVIVREELYKRFFRPQVEDGSGIGSEMIDSAVIGAFGKLAVSGGKTVYIQLKNFGNPAYTSFMSVMEKLAGNLGIDTLYLDLRNCGNGVDIEVAKIANQFFFQKGVLMMEADFFNGSKDIYNSTGKVFFPVKHINVLINEKVSGVAILLARILKNNGITTIVGDVKHTIPPVVRHFPLSDGNYFRMPVGKYSFSVEKEFLDEQSSELNPDLIMGIEGINRLLGKR